MVERNVVGGCLAACQALHHTVVPPHERRCRNGRAVQHGTCLLWATRQSRRHLLQIVQELRQPSFAQRVVLQALQKRGVFERIREALSQRFTGPRVVREPQVAPHLPERAGTTYQCVWGAGHEHENCFHKSLEKHRHTINPHRNVAWYKQRTTCFNNRDDCCFARP